MYIDETMQSNEWKYRTHRRSVIRELVLELFSSCSWTCFSSHQWIEIISWRPTEKTCMPYKLISIKITIVARQRKLCFLFYCMHTFTLRKLRNVRKLQRKNISLFWKTNCKSVTAYGLKCSGAVLILSWSVWRASSLGICSWGWLVPLQNCQYWWSTPRFPKLFWKVCAISFSTCKLLTAWLSQVVKKIDGQRIKSMPPGL